MATYSFEGEIPIDGTSRSVWAQAIDHEDWEGVFPSKSQLKKKLRLFNEWCKKYEFSPIHIATIAYKKQLSIGIPFEAWCEWNAVNQVCPVTEKTRLIGYIKALQLEEPEYSSASSSRRTSISSTADSAQDVNTGTPKRVCRRESDAEGMVADFVAEQVTPSIENSGTQKPSKDDFNTAIKVKPGVPKPIVVHNIPRDQIGQFIKMCEGDGDIDFSVKPMPENYLKVFPVTHWDKFRIMQLLEEKKVPFYIIPDVPRVLKVVIGRIEVYEAADIQECLTRNGFNIIQVYRMTSRRDGKPLPLFLVTLEKDQHADTIFELESILRIRVKVSPYRPPKKAIQCYRCNRFNHIARNCKMEPRCCICSSNHESRDCPNKQLPVEQRKKPSCCNCNKEHVASYKGCEKFPNRPTYAQMLQKKTPTKPASDKLKKISRDKKAESTQQLQSPVQLYDPHELGGDALELYRTIQELKAELEVSSLTDLLQELKDTLKILQGMHSTTEKRLAFLEAMTRNSTKAAKASTASSSSPKRHSP